VLVVDRGSALGDSWRKRYDRLHLHTPRVQSALPGLAIPRRFGTEVRRLEQDGDSRKAHGGGPPLQVRQVVTATGSRAG
jgi:cation diffusion facilitator CzcD-associated flavoprotein CzcO